mmetsp:Transcript_57752/g.65912  ORF Transcript_57752/g.65912 Transcript_57752/m.65912 type:complete len:154 (+) Transcript_57752:80-541(+)
METSVPEEFKGTASKITDNIYLGNAENASDIDYLKALKVTHILTVAQIPSFYPDDFTYKQIKIDDDLGSDIKACFEECNEFIESVVNEGKIVLVHCLGGVSRSATVVMAYLMHSRRWKFEKALEFVRASRKAAGPNPNFERQIRAYEVELGLN